MMPLKKPSKGMLLKISQYAMGAMMAKRIPANTDASTLFIIFKRLSSVHVCRCGASSVPKVCFSGSA